MDPYATAIQCDIHSAPFATFKNSQSLFFRGSFLRVGLRPIRNRLHKGTNNWIRGWPGIAGVLKEIAPGLSLQFLHF